MTVPIVTKKTCTKCKVEQALLEYAPNKGCRGGFSTICRKCQKSYHQNRRIKPTPVADLPNEEWRVIPRFPNYAASNYGRVKRITDGEGTYAGRLLKPAISKKGYWNLNFHKQTVAVHIVVAEAFYGRRKQDMEINHIDADKSNNTPANLEYISHLDNMRHASANGRMTGEVRQGITALTPSQVKEIRTRFDNGATAGKLAKIYGVHRSTLDAIKKRKTWKHL